MEKSGAAAENREVRRAEQYVADKLLTELAKFFSSSYIVGESNNCFAFEVSAKVYKYIFHIRYVSTKEWNSWYLIYYLS